MRRQKSKKRPASQSYTARMLKEINATKFAGSELMRFGNEVHQLEPKDCDFEGRTIVAIQFFNGDSKRVMSALFRRKLLQESYPKPVLKDGSNLRNRKECFTRIGHCLMRRAKRLSELSGTGLSSAGQRY